MSGCMKLQAGCYTLNLTTKIVHSLFCHTMPWANTSHVCVRVDAERARAYPRTRPCKFCMTEFNIRVMDMRDRIGAHTAQPQAMQGGRA